MRAGGRGVAPRGAPRLKFMWASGRAAKMEERLSSVMPGSCVGVWYEGEEPLWHARVVLWPVGAGEFYIVTPDLDKYVESYRCQGEGDSPVKCSCVGHRLRDSGRAGLLLQVRSVLL